MSEAGNPASHYTWTVNGQKLNDETISQIQIEAQMELNGALLGCNVSNNYTTEKSTPKYDTRNLIIECKLLL